MVPSGKIRCGVLSPTYFQPSFQTSTGWDTKSQPKTALEVAKSSIGVGSLGLQ